MRERGKIPYNIDVQSADEKGRRIISTHLDIIVQANVSIGSLGAIFISVGINL